MTVQNKAQECGNPGSLIRLRSALFSATFFPLVNVLNDHRRNIPSRFMHPLHSICSAIPKGRVKSERESNAFDFFHTFLIIPTLRFDDAKANLFIVPFRALLEQIRIHRPQIVFTYGLNMIIQNEVSAETGTPDSTTSAAAALKMIFMIWFLFSTKKWIPSNG